MKLDSVYAVVDIETTGTNVKDGARIIQFGCVLLQNGEILQKISMDVQPNCPIPDYIQKLTGITPAQLVAAPYFEDVAATIYNILSGCVFVAHNIQFDLPFLNAELERCGFSALQLEGIDTVELAQILLPTAPSYRLQDLANQFDLQHDNPHQADSDAFVTAKILLLLTEKIQTLPLVTLEKISEMADVCAMDTARYLQLYLAAGRMDPQPLKDNLYIKQGIALRQKKVPLPQTVQYEMPNYPDDDKAKQQIFSEYFQIRQPQNQMMNEVYQHFTRKTPIALGIEAETGIGKTFGYLLPLIFLIPQGKKFVISTYTSQLQTQLIDKEMQQLKKIIPYELTSAIVKSPSHYIDLSQFILSLQVNKRHKKTILNQMSVLVWLTETTTGDLDELQRNDQDQRFWENIRYHREVTDFTDNNWAEDDFLYHARACQKNAQIVVTNHAYLCYHPESFQDSYLIVDEAQHLNEVASAQTQKQITFTMFKRIRQRIGHSSDEASLSSRILSISELSADWQRCWQNIEWTLEQCTQNIEMFFNDCTAFYQLADIDEWLLPEGFFALQEIDFKKNLKLLQNYQQELLLLINNWQSQAEEQAISGKQDQQALATVLIILKDLEEYMKQLSAFINHTTIYRFIKTSDCYQNHEIALGIIENSPQEILQERVIPNFSKIIFTGATLNPKNQLNYFAQGLGYEDLAIAQLKSPYQLNQQAELWYLTDVESVKDLPTNVYHQMLADKIIAIAKATDKRLLVLFTSLDTVSAVYGILERRISAERFPILAQGVSGSREKILKIFNASNEGILLGADSFWEGIDLPGNALEVLVVTRLPFESPERLAVKLRQQQLKNSGQDIFLQDAIPRCGLKLRQGLGRLIRSESDKGIMLVLDNRLWSSSYGHLLRQSLPKELPIKKITTDSLTENFNEFF